MNCCLMTLAFWVFERVPASAHVPKYFLPFALIFVAKLLATFAPAQVGLAPMAVLPVCVTGGVEVDVGVVEDGGGGEVVELDGGGTTTVVEVLEGGGGACVVEVLVGGGGA